MADMSDLLNPSIPANDNISQIDQAESEPVKQLPPNPYAPIDGVPQPPVTSDVSSKNANDMTSLSQEQDGEAEQMRGTTKAEAAHPSSTLPPLALPQLAAKSAEEQPEQPLEGLEVAAGSGPAEIQRTRDHEATNEQSSTLRTLASDETAPVIKSEVNQAIRDAIPAFIPVTSIKREQTASQTPAAEGPDTLPSIEELPRGTKRPAPKSAGKKGLAKKPPAKKQKLEPGTKSKPKSKAGLKKSVSMSASATPMGSSPAPNSIRGFSPSPTTADMSNDDEEDDVEEDGSDAEGEVYCICRRPDKGTFMIGCDGRCDDWYHGKCVGIQEKDKNLIDRYICPICVENGVGVTTWKRMCRRPGCRMPARLAKKNEEPSKYCSDECGIIFFRDQLQKTRMDSKGASRKRQMSPEDDLGPRGGVIHRQDLKALVSIATTFEEFKKLGDAVLSPPATPSPTDSKAKKGLLDSDEHLDESQIQRLREIQTKKEELRGRHTLLKDQAKMLNLVRQAGVRAAESKGIKPKDVCGYDTLVSLNEADFADWRSSAEGQAALKTGVLEAKTDANGDTEMKVEEGVSASKLTSGPCLKKKCARHAEWSKLAQETNRSETMENSETMRALEREERDIRERAELKARQIRSGDLGGYVEHHRAGAQDELRDAPPVVDGHGLGVVDTALPSESNGEVVSDAMQIEASA